MSCNFERQNVSGKSLLILVDGDFVGGAETNYRFILPGLLSRGWRPVFVCPEDQNLRAYFDAFGHRIETATGMLRYPPFSVGGRTSPMNLFRVFAAIRVNRRRVMHLIREHSAVAVISNSMVSHLLNASLPLDPGYRRVVHLHDIVNRRKARGLYGKGLDWISRRVDAIITISDAVVETIPKSERYKSTKLYNPIGEMPVRKRAREERLRVGMFARYTKWKGHGDLLQIAATCTDAPVEFVSFGNVSASDQVYLDGLKTMAQALKHPDRLRLNGFTPDPLQEMADCDFVLHLSTSPEPFGRVLIEANACGVPILAYRGGGVDELFENLGLFGERFSNGDWAAVAAFILAAAAGNQSTTSVAEALPKARLGGIAAENYVDSYLRVCHD
ncbi:MAG: glycosyltransferase [Opitutaceae bacterium]